MVSSVVDVDVVVDGIGSSVVASPLDDDVVSSVVGSVGVTGSLVVGTVVEVEVEVEVEVVDIDVVVGSPEVGAVDELAIDAVVDESPSLAVIGPASL